MSEYKTKYVDIQAFLDSENRNNVYDHRDLMEKLEAFPAADVEPVVRGEWKEMRDPYGDLTGWIHEECGRETDFASEYCSKCGAKMTFVERIGSGE